MEELKNTNMFNEVENITPPEELSESEKTELCNRTIDNFLRDAEERFSTLVRSLKKDKDDVIQAIHEELGVVNTNKLLNLDSENIKYEPEIPDDYVTIEQAVAENIMDSYYLQFFRSMNCACGAPYAISKTLKSIGCCSLRCTSVLARAINDLATEYNIRGLGKTKSEEIIRVYGYNSLLDFLRHPPVDYVYDVEDILSTQYDYADAIKLLHMPDLNTEVNKIFKNINGYEDFCNKVDKVGGLENFISLSIGGDKKPYKYAKVLRAYMYELANIHRVLDIKQQAEKTVNIVITGSPAPDLGKGRQKMTKKEYIKLINSIRSENIKFNLVESVGTACCCITDSNTTTSKYVAAQKAGKLCTSTALVQILVSPEVFYDIFFHDTKEERIAKDKENGTYRESPLTLDMLRSVGIYFFEGGNI